MFHIDKYWNCIFEREFEKEYFKDLLNFIKNEYSRYTVYPQFRDVFAAFNLCHFEDLKVVILGQDPYPGEGQANGLCFSVNNGVSIPKSLQNIFREVKNDIGFVNSEDGDLSRWAMQGVLLLNTTLTVRANQPGSHFNHGWEIFTDNIIRYINENKSNVVYILWGNKAIQKYKILNTKNNLILTSSHPSPLSAYNGFFGNHHFSNTNYYLIEKGLKQIDWS